jgi:methylated-DNA-protein-cysteine methyltransferase-like protein
MARELTPAEAAIRSAIRRIPRGEVATYGQVAAAAGYPRHHRQVVQVLRDCGDSLPWQRVLGAGGRIRLRGHHALEQRTRLEMEGVRFSGKRVDMAAHQWPAGLKPSRRKRGSPRATGPGTARG